MLLLVLVLVFFVLWSRSLHATEGRVAVEAGKAFVGTVMDLGGHVGFVVVV